jgi:PAS domain S-box-containing protein
VTAFLRQARRFTSQTAIELEQFSSSWNAATHRVSSSLSNEAADGSVNVIDEMRARDEELKAVSEELSQQIETLQRSCVLLERERAKYVDLFEHAPDAYVVTTLGGTVHEANVAARVLFGVESGFLTGRPLISFVARQDTRAFRAFLHESQAADIRRPAAARALTLRVRPRGQSVFVVTARVAIVRSGAGRPIALRWMLRRLDRGEVTAGGKLANGELARLLADDLGRPLTPILEWSRALREGAVRDDEERRQALRWIEESASAQRRMLDDLTELAELSCDAEGGDSGVVDLAERAAAVIAAIAKVEPMRLELRSSGPEAPHVRVDAARIDRALELLVRRGLDGTPQRAGAVRVAVSSQGEHAVVEIEAPECARTPHGWTLRSAIVASIVEAESGELILNDANPSARVLLPRLRG